MKWLRHHRAMLIGEVVPLAYLYLRSNPAADERTRFRHVVVDEYQDLNLLEQRLIDLLVGPGAAICVVGDDDQSIYRFRYAYPQGIVTFVTTEGTERREINECGRCPQPVLAIANTLMHSAPNRARADLTCAQPTPGRVAVVQWDNLDGEVEGLAGFVASQTQGERREAGDFIVLVNRREIGYRIRNRLDQLGVEARSFFVDNALEKSQKAQQSLALLRLFVDRAERVALRVWLAGGDSKGRREAYRRLQESATGLGLSEYDALDGATRGNVALQAIALKRRMTVLQDRLAALEGMDLQTLVDQLFGDDSDDVRGIREIARDLLETVDLPRALLEGLVRAISQPEIPQRPDFVRIMSLHKSKGLTSSVVIVGAALDGIVPTVKDKWSDEEKQDAYDEQRRLFYVAVTRSSDELLISSAKRLPWGEAQQLGVRFGATRDVNGVLVVECLATPYLAECGAALPMPLNGPIWLAQRS